LRELGYLEFLEMVSKKHYRHKNSLINYLKLNYEDFDKILMNHLHLEKYKEDDKKIGKKNIDLFEIKEE
jgi:hypothetical protein